MCLLAVENFVPFSGVEIFAYLRICGSARLRFARHFCQSVITYTS